MKEKRMLTVAVSPDLLEKLRYVARQECRSMSGLTRVVLDRYLRDWEGINGEIPR